MGKHRVGWVLAAAFALVTVTAIPGGAATPAEGGRFWDDDGNVHESNIEAIASVGVTLGCVPEGTAYCPELAVTRAQMASFLARASQPLADRRRPIHRRTNLERAQREHQRHCRGRNHPRL